MAIQTITYGDKTDLQTTATADINKIQASDLNEIKSVVNNNATMLDKFGKELWTGSFSSGNITVTGISDYTLIGVYVGNVIMIGNQYYGGTPFRTYQSTSISTYAYRYTYDSTNEKLTIDTQNPGATNGSSNQTVTKIVGLI